MIIQIKASTNNNMKLIILMISVTFCIVGNAKINLLLLLSQAFWIIITGETNESLGLFCYSLDVSNSFTQEMAPPV